MTIIGFEDMILSLYLIILMVADGSMQLYTNYISNNFTRLITGLGFGYASFSILIFVIKIFINIF